MPGLSRTGLSGPSRCGLNIGKMKLYYTLTKSYISYMHVKRIVFFQSRSHTRSQDHIFLARSPTLHDRILCHSMVKSCHNILFFSCFAAGVILCFLFLWRNAACWRKSFIRKRSTKWYYPRYSWRLQSSHIWKFVFWCWFMQLHFRYYVFADSDSLVNKYAHLWISAEYDPICVDGRITFFSPCHAGCDSRNVSQITNCGCVGSPADNDVAGASGVDFSERVSFGSCDSHLEGCHFEVFLALIFIVLFFTFVNGIPATNAILRVVPPELRIVLNQNFVT